MSRSFLLLQGVATPFFSELAKALKLQGHPVLKINYCGGDLFSGRFFNPAGHHINFTDTLDKLPTFYTETFNQHKITDILLFGDTRPIHQSAIEIAKQIGIRLHVFEEGYFRPDWITLDSGGVNANSSLSKDPQFYIKNSNIKIKDTKPTGGNLAIRAWHDIRYHGANLLFSPLFPHAKSHRPDRALKEYWGWIKRLPMLLFFHNDKAKKTIQKVITGDKPHYLLPLQLNADSQIKIHSSIQSVSEVIQITIKSFSEHAPKDSLLVIKNHPLDPWFVNYPDVIEQAVKDYSVDANRIVYIEAGDLNALLKKTRGVVLVNSTVGTSALVNNCPVIALGDAIYDIQGLTFQGSLDNFWLKATPPNKELFKSFQTNIIKNSQINGAFYNKKGIAMAVEGSIKHLDAIAK